MFGSLVGRSTPTPPPLGETSQSQLYAAPPFDHPQADIILRSSDNVDFRVFKLFLSLASPFFQTLFELPQPTNSNQTSNDVEMKDGLPVISVSEGSNTLDLLLRFCYPCTLAEDPALDNFNEAYDVLEAANKYSLEVIAKIVCRSLFVPKILESSSLSCFAVARRADLHELCALAARHTLREPLVPAWFEEISMITSSDLLALLIYHQKCAGTVRVLQSNLSWIKNHYQQYNAVPWMFGLQTNGYSGCGCGRSSSSKYELFGQKAALWWEDFLDKTFTALSDKPCAETIQKCVQNAIQACRSRNCTSCMPMITGGMQEFEKLFTEKVVELVSQVSVHFL
ncbi:hypothetical protein ID866_5245 [Astraeus odoratus]|nr:hypothetical protein ID866_5245 [Astraeus odoratus]